MQSITSTFAAASAAIALCAGSSALAAAVPVSVVGASSSYPGYAAADAVDAASNTDWASNGDGVGSFIDFNLGSSVQLDGFTLVDRVTSGGDNGTFNGGTSDFTTGFTLASYSDASFTTVTGSQAYTKTAPSSPTSANDFMFSDSTTLKGQYIRYLVGATQGANPGLEDISFDASGGEVSAAPEPGVWALMFAGVAMIGAMLRLGRRQQDTTLTA